MDSYELLACDIDGTLLDKEKNVSQATVDAFAELKKAGKQIVLISARMPKAIRYLQKDLLILQSPLIAYNGGLTFLSGEEPAAIHEEGLPPALTEQIAGLLKGTEVQPGLYSADEWYVQKSDRLVEKEIFNTKTEPDMDLPAAVLRRWEQRGQKVHKVMLMGSAEDMKKVDQRMKDSTLQGFEVYRSKDVMFEITSSATSKENALKTLCDKLGVPLSKVVAIGDNDNDIGMIQAAGCGVAVENAKDKLKEVADMITDKNTEDGVAKAIRKLFF
ncbi:HAD family hydrolase [Roseivirga sp. BDSF3-8]|uniref:HAD family hydrolase n=1 Tax=Roseivirga sp. BDSF3-8 TaxID=3241598 RepID=UPI00353182DE